MRTRSLVLLIFLVLGTSVSGAAPSDRRETRDPIERIIRVIKSVFGVATNSDVLTPPKP